MFLRPTRDLVAIEPDDPDAITEAGIIIPESAQKKTQAGVVLAVGPGRIAEKTGMLIEPRVKVGDHVAFQKYSGTEIEHDGTTVLLMAESTVVGIFEEG